MTQQATAPITKSFPHLFNLADVKMRAQTAFEYYRDKDKEANAGVNPTFTWRRDGRTADVTFTFNKKVMTGTIKVTASSMPGVSKDGTVELGVDVPDELRLFAPSMIALVGKEIAPWLEE